MIELQISVVNVEIALPIIILRSVKVFGLSLETNNLIILKQNSTGFKYGEYGGK